MILSCIVAVSQNDIIGRQNDLPWHLPEDLKRFRRLTMGHPIIMGRRTYESIGRPLPGRTSIIISRDQEYARDGTVIVHSLDEALQSASAENGNEAFVIGGRAIFELALPRAGRLHMTVIHADVEGDVHFPAAALDSFTLVEDERHEADAKHAHDYSFRLYERDVDCR